LLDYKWKSNIIITVDLQINEFERILWKKLDMKIYSFEISTLVYYAKDKEI
jgi:hypothetical protein